MVKKTAVNKGTPAPAQAAPEAVPTAETSTVVEILTPHEHEFIELVRSGKDIREKREAARNLMIDEAAERLKAMESDEDVDKALDFIGRITGTGGHFRAGNLKRETPFHTFYQLSLHLAMAMWSEWFDSDELFAGGEPGENEKADLTQFVPWIERQIRAAFDSGKVDVVCMLNWINTTNYRTAEFVDKRGVQVWLGTDNLKEAVARQAAGSDE